MKVVKQETGIDCGHACLATVTHQTLKEIKAKLPNRALSGFDITRFLKSYFQVDYIKHEMRLQDQELSLPYAGILNTPHKPRKGHWVVKLGDIILCPHYGEEHIDTYLKKCLGVMSTISFDEF